MPSRSRTSTLSAASVPAWPFLRRSEPSVICATNAAAQLVPNKSHAWLDDKSIVTARRFTAGLIDRARAVGIDKTMRKSGRIPTCTHFIETSDLAVNLGSDLGLPPEVIAFAAYTHDLIEDFRDFLPSEQPARLIVERCWRGDSRYKALLIDTLEKITDNPLLDPKERLAAQVVTANDPRTPALVSLIRFCDKLSALNRDYTTLLRGEMPFGDEGKFRAYYAKRESHLAQLQRVPARLKRWYGRLVKKVEAELGLQDDFPRRRQLYAAGTPLRNDFLDPISLVMRSSAENKEAQEKMRPLSSFRRLVASLAP